eukprot:TRINITY_DN41724_c0_g3_i1.p1 TRINITY_DN41724_c0_g3~~TRINITY_DN41724_c0_g3_i1.p1  ORF type:complete len:531 (-),score=140.78 TRINITY_DN41724_c0_g3_i1:173-1699(-)
MSGGVLEIAALGALAAGAMGHGHVERERQLQQERAAADLYRKYFQEDLLAVSADKRTRLSGQLPSGLHPRAAECIRSIERFQDEKRQTFFGLSQSAEREGDIQTHILEELKQWLLTVADVSMSPKEVRSRLDYCRQLLLRQSVLAGGSTTAKGRTFVQSVADVCQQLEALCEEAVSHERRSSELMEGLIGKCRDLFAKSMPLLLWSLPEMVTLEDGSPPQDTAARVLAALRLEEGAAAPSSCAAAAALVNKEGDVGRVLGCVLGAEHVQRLCHVDVHAGDSLQDVPSLLAQLRHEGHWLAEQVLAQKTGIADRFAHPEDQQARASYLAMVEHLDRVTFFADALRPFHDLASRLGDLAICRLQTSLCHLLLELEKALTQLHQARLEVLQAVRRKLHALGRRFSTATGADRAWMRQLRAIPPDAEVEAVQRGLAADCLLLRSNASVDNAAKLQADAEKDIRQALQVFQSSDFQFRCNLSLPEGVVRDIRALCAGSGGRGAAARLPLTDQG